MSVLRAEELAAEIERREKKYIKQPDGSYKCRKCSSIIQAVSVSHPIWDGPFAMSGGGRVFNESKPYCPKCEEKPSDRGSPIAPKGSYHNP